MPKPPKKQLAYQSRSTGGMESRGETYYGGDRDLSGVTRGSSGAYVEVSRSITYPRAKSRNDRVWVK